MTADHAHGLLNEFLAGEARSAVVRIRIPELAPDALFSGFFVSPEGHLVTAFHAVKAFAFELPCQFDVLLEFDGAAASLRTPARCEPGWCDPVADWVVLQTELRPSPYLPVAAPHLLARDRDPLCAELRVYGFTVTEQGTPHLGALAGQYLRPAPERRRFHVAFSVRGRGQSGGPAIDMRSHAVVGSVVGYRQDEQLTADLAAIDQETLAPIGRDLAELARRWRLRATRHVSERHPELGVLTVSDQFIPGFPGRHLAERRPAVEVLEPLAAGRRPVCYLHGPPGSGKTVLALQTAHALVDAGRATALFWHDFEPPQHRPASNLIRRLAVHLLHHDEAVEPLQACLADGFVRDPSAAITALAAALRRARHVLVLDNLQFVQRSVQRELSALLDTIAALAGDGGPVVIFTSWDWPPATLEHATHRVDGLDRPEVARLLDLHGVTVTDRGMDLVCSLATDITCVEAFVRSPAWRAEVDRGRAGRPGGAEPAEPATPAEPAELHRHWLNRFLGQVPQAGRQVLLALAVLDQPAPRDLVEEVAGVRHFAATLDRLLTSPPLVHSDGDQFHAHYNVKRAALAVADRTDVVAMHGVVATASLRRGDALDAARHLVRAGRAGAALELLFGHRDRIIAAGRVQDLQDLTADLRVRLQDRPELGHRLHAILASCSNIRGDYLTATRHWGFALRRSPAGAERAALHNRKGDSHRMASDYRSARAEYEAAAEHAAGNGADGDQALRELGRARLGLAKLDRLGCDYAAARRHYDEARECFDLVFDEPGLIEADFGLGEVNRLTADWAAASASYRASLERARRHANLEREAYALWGIGEVQRLSGEHADARQTHERGLQLCRQVGDTRSEGWALLGLAENARMAGSTGVMALHEEARNRFARTGSETELAHTALGAAEAGRAAGLLELPAYRAVLGTYRAKNLRHCEVICLLCHAAALRAAGLPEQAGEQLDLAAGIAAECALTHELRQVDDLRGNPLGSPFLPLNFP